MYNVSIAIRVENSRFGDDGFSDESTINFTSISSKPDRPPNTDLGAFHFANKEKCEVDIFWNQLSTEESNGGGLTYPIQVYQNGKLNGNKKPKTSIAKATARFDEICDDSQYEFRIYSKNDVGYSINYSPILIPSRKNIIEMPIPTSKHLSNRVYRLIWRQPSSYAKITNYTIFWCEPMDEQETLCSTSINYDIVPSDLNEYIFNNTSEETTKIFAISANTNDARSGMAWFPCSASNISDMTKFPAHTEVLSSNSLVVSWSLRCDTTLSLQGFNLSYCPVDETNIKKCIGKVSF